MYMYASYIMKFEIDTVSIFETISKFLSNYTNISNDYEVHMFYACPRQTPGHASVIPAFVNISYDNNDKSVIYCYRDQC